MSRGAQSGIAGWPKARDCVKSLGWSEVRKRVKSLKCAPSWCLSPEGQESEYLPRKRRQRLTASEKTPAATCSWDDTRQLCVWDSGFGFGVHGSVSKL